MLHSEYSILAHTGRTTHEVIPSPFAERINGVKDVSHWRHARETRFVMISHVNGTSALDSSVLLNNFHVRVRV